MTYTMPSYVQPLLQIYGLKWPDVDEDEVKSVGHDVKELADAAHEFARAVEEGLSALAGEADSDALRSMHEFWSDFASGPVFQVTDAFGQGAATVCDVTSGGILVYKQAVTGVLIANCAADIALIASGVGIPAAAAKKVLMRQALEYLFDQLAAQYADYILGLFNRYLDEYIFGPIDDLVNKLRDDVVERAAKVVAMAVPVHAGSVGLAALYIDHDDVVHAAQGLHSSYNRLHGALSAVAGHLKSKDLSTPNTAAPDPVVRTVLEQAVHWLGEQLMKLLEDIAQETVNQIIDTITGIYDKYVEADKALAGMAQQLRDEYKFPPRAHAFQIDRSTQPKPVHIVDAPPMVVTGAGVSDAREDIIVIDLPDILEPVVTGPGESDARLDIRQILLPEAPEPVHTGAGTSDAREGIQQIVLPSAGGDDSGT